MKNENMLGPITEIKLNLIDFGPTNRKDHDKAKLQSLADSIKTDGLQNAVILRAHPTKPGRYQLIAGERRTRSCLLLKWDAIPARIDTGKAEVGAVRKRAVENFQREDLTALEEAQLFRELTVDHKLTQEEAGKIAGVGQSYVANSLRMLEHPKEVQQLVQDGKLSRAHAVTLCRFAKWPKIVKRMAELAVKGGETSKELEDEDVPYSHTLKREKLVVECTDYDYQRGYSYTVPATLLKDPAFIGHDSDCWCMEPEKWEPEKKRQDAEQAKKQKSKDKAEGARQSTMDPAEKKARQKKIADNKRNRIESAAATESALEILRDAKTLTKGMLIAVVSRVLNQGSYSGALKEAAAKIGVSLPPKLVTSSWYSSVSFEKLQKMSELDLVRLTAAAIVHHHGAEAVKYSQNPPEATLAILPKGAHKTLQRVEVTVTMTSSNNIARAGNVTKNCTSDAKIAARDAAARYLGCSPGDVTLVVKVPGAMEGKARVYTASKGGGK